VRFYTENECEDWLHQRGRKKPGESTPHVQRIGYPTEPYRVFGLAHWLATSHTHRMPVLLWILTQANYLNAFFSHDEYMDFFVSDDKALDDLRTSLTDAGL